VRRQLAAFRRELAALAPSPGEEALELAVECKRALESP
jgi:hypothetical protein